MTRVDVVRASILLAAGFVAMCIPASAQEQQVAPGQAGKGLVFSAVPTKETILRGEPLFIKVELTNNGDKPERISLLAGDTLSQSEWRLEIAKGNDAPFRTIELRSVRELVYKPGGSKPLLNLEPGGKLTDCLTMWFANRGDTPDERGLVFRQVGVYRYRMTMLLRSDSRSPYQELTASGRVKVTGRPKGFTPMVRGLRGIMFDEAHVRFRDRQKLEALLEDKEVKDSPYADFVKWLRIRSYLRDGALADNDILESGGAPARREMDLLTKLSDDLLKNDMQKDLAPPIWRDAMLARGMVHLVSDRKAEAVETLKQVDAEFPQSKESNKLRGWTN